MTARERSKSDFDIKNRKHKKSTFEKRSTFEFIYHAVVQQSEALALAKQNPKNVLNLDFLDLFHYPFEINKIICDFLEIGYEKSLSHFTVLGREVGDKGKIFDKPIDLSSNILTIIEIFKIKINFFFIKLFVSICG